MLFVYVVGEIFRLNESVDGKVFVKPGDGKKYKIHLVKKESQI
jgi:hypothetical protein